MNQLKKILYVFGLTLFLAACQESEVVAPQVNVPEQSGVNELNTLNENKADRIPKKSTRVKLNDDLSYNLSSFVPGQIYVARENALYAFFTSDAYRYKLNSDMPYMHVMASVNGMIFGVINDTLYKIDPVSGAFSVLGTGWSGTEVMAAGKIGTTPYVFAIQGGQIWRVNATNGTFVSLGSGWQGAEAMTFGGGWLYISWGDQLWKMNGSTSLYGVIEAYGWSGTEAMTFYNNYVYAVQGGTIWKTATNGGSTSLGGGWSGTAAMTNHGGSLYMVTNGLMYKINPSTGSAVQWGSDSWSSTWSMAAVQP